MKVDRIIRIEEHRANINPPVPMPAFRAGAMAADAAPPVAPGELEIRASVTVVAAIR